MVVIRIFYEMYENRSKTEGGVVTTCFVLLDSVSVVSLTITAIKYDPHPSDG